ncbi:Polynucleotide 5'-hydroxyl-kinase grc3 [Apophysomyces sp. BC1034]|nr:Polynucleotide 5'-hydroxyl-kinase grc3 [Apophysomyces sp. BC1015]KAG0170345.1 Polynucleotide 5'-hydroxyl-kinase grc3 [Apophysomyces sp. BC1021]KAG0184620.1 Polynucleotide 5'-hydroxyl-kinase grc3 [Apophysomyces sp. BC1034]
MPAKRKARANASSSARAERQDRRTKVPKIDRDDQADLTKEVKAVVLPETTLITANAPVQKPMSAIAARRAARELAAKTTPVEVEAEVLSDGDEDVTYSAVSGLEDEDEEDGDTAEDQDEIYNKEVEQAETNDQEAEAPADQRKARRSRRRNIPKAEAEAEPRTITKNMNCFPDSVSRFTPTESNVMSFTKDEETYLCIGLQKDESLVFVGQALVAPLFGAVSVLGAVLSSGNPVPSSLPSSASVSFHPIFSPRTHALLVIEPARHDSVEPRQTLVSESFDDAGFLEPMKKHLSKFQAIFVVKGLQWCDIDDVEDVVPLFKDIFRPNKQGKTNEAIHSIAGFQPILEVSHGVKAMKAPLSWELSVSRLIEVEKDYRTPAISVICGSKKVGKSTFGRYLVNRLLNTHKRVAFLESDLGQTEFTPSGTVALHILDSPILGPPFTHQHLQPRRSYFLGASSPRDDPSYYLDCVAELLQLWRFECDNGASENESDVIPLVLNTQGWTKGLGYDLLLSIIQKASPTDIFAFHSNTSPTRNLPSSFNSAIVPVDEAQLVQSRAPTLHRIETTTCIGTWANKYHAADHRALTLVSYFHQELGVFGQADQAWWNFKSRMVERLPWVLNWNQGLNGIWVLYEDVPLSQLLYALNGTVVALLGDIRDNEEVDGPFHEAEDAIPGQLVPPKYYPSLQFPPPPPAKTTCHGLAIIRAIDPSRHALLLLTPLPLEKLKKVSGIVKGDIELPVWCMLDRHLGGGSGIAGTPWRRVPYTTVEAQEGVGGNALRMRRNLRRRAHN